MSFPINILNFKEYISKDNFTLEVYNSDIFYRTMVCFSILATLEDLVIEIDREDSYTIHNKMQWMEFLQIYYNKFHRSGNILKAMLREGTIPKADIDFVNESIPFTIDALKTIFRENKKEPIFFANIIFAGRFYSSLHYYLRSLESFSEEHFDLKEKHRESLRNLAIIIQERNWIDVLYNDLMKQKETGVNIHLSEDIHEKLTTVWDRTLQFFETELVPEFIPHCA